MMGGRRVARASRVEYFSDRRRPQNGCAQRGEINKAWARTGLDASSSLVMRVVRGGGVR